MYYFIIKIDRKRYQNFNIDVLVGAYNAATVADPVFNYLMNKLATVMNKFETTLYRMKY